MGTCPSAVSPTSLGRCVLFRGNRSHRKRHHRQGKQRSQRSDTGASYPASPRPGSQGSTNLFSVTHASSPFRRTLPRTTQRDFLHADAASQRWQPSQPPSQSKLPQRPIPSCCPPSPAKSRDWLCPFRPNPNIPPKPCPAEPTEALDTHARPIDESRRRFRMGTATRKLFCAGTSPVPSPTVRR